MTMERVPSMNARSRLLAKSVACAFLFVINHSSFLAAQEVEWRRDYNQARGEATASGKPILIDFGTENCYWCKQLDATTFRDPKITGLLRERFVALKIDAHRDAPLAEALRVQAYPTLVLAAQMARSSVRMKAISTPHACKNNCSAWSPASPTPNG